MGLKHDLIEELNKETINFTWIFNLAKKLQQSKTAIISTTVATAMVITIGYNYANANKL
jgi:hypothetical protein